MESNELVSDLANFGFDQIDEEQFELLRAGKQPVITHVVALPPMSTYSGDVISKIKLAKTFYFDPRNQEGSFDERMQKLQNVIKKSFESYREIRMKQYSSAKASYLGWDWNKPRNYTWRSMECEQGFVFIIDSLVKTGGGSWKDGPVWEKNNTFMKWQTGGHGRSETTATVTAVYSGIQSKVEAEINVMKADLNREDIPTLGL